MLRHVDRSHLSRLVLNNGNDGNGIPDVAAGESVSRQAARGFVFTFAACESVSDELKNREAYALSKQKRTTRGNVHTVHLATVIDGQKS